MRPRILIVEDNAVNEMYLMTICDKLGLDYDVCDDGYEAINKIMNNTYDLFLLDIQLPNINGIEIAQFIRDSNYSTPIIAQTAFTDDEAIFEMKQAGFNEIIFKPYSYGDIRKIILKYLGTKYDKCYKDSATCWEARQGA
jgi:CheY-like chemotaxis protein